VADDYFLSFVLSTSDYSEADSFVNCISPAAWPTCSMIGHAYGGACAIVTMNLILRNMSLKWPEKPISILSQGKRYNLFTIANKLFPTSFLVKIIAFLLWTSPIIFNFLQEHDGIDSILIRGLITVAIVGGMPTVVVYLITLAHAPSIRKHHQMIDSRQPDAVTTAMDARKNYEVAIDKSTED
jgi:hypothetical protein